MQFECPVCQKTLIKELYEGTNTYPCPDGCGVFLGRKNLRIIEESREESMSLASLSKNGDERGSIKNCPKCKGRMIKKNYGELYSTVIDYCAGCQGIWLAPGELEHIQVYYEAADDFNDKPFGKRIEPAFVCPKCQTEQVKGEVCSDCGLVFSKYDSRLREEKAHRDIRANFVSQIELLLAGLTRIDVEQRFHLTEVVFAFERKNFYRLTLFPADEHRNTWHIEEENVSALSILGRNLFGLLYTSTMRVKDTMGNVVLRLYRKPRLYFHALEVYDENGEEIGLIKRRFSYFHRVLSVDNPNGRNQLRVIGPIWNPWTFNIYDGRTRVAVIYKRWTGFLKEAYTDADRFEIQFVGPLTTKKSRLSIGTLMLVDALYFEGKASFFNHLLSAPGIQLIGSAGAIWWMVNEKLL